MRLLDINKNNKLFSGGFLEAGGHENIERFRATVWECARTLVHVAESKVALAVSLGGREERGQRT